MCIINEPADVTKTCILVAPDTTNQRQVTVYENQVMNESRNNMMILPVPNPDTIDFIDLSRYTKVFTDLDVPFKEMTLSANRSTNSHDTLSLLDVIDVGSYRVSLAKNIAELDYVDSNEFGIVGSNIKAILSKYYSKDWGFVICKLRNGDVKYHPLAYSHKMLNNQLFAPTRHHHKTIVEEAISDWDHNIYSFNTYRDAGNCRLVTPRVTFEFAEFKGFNFAQPKTLNKLSIHGNLPNRDYVFPIIA